ncbi:MAG: hypothetical protein GY782_06615 [Gammaproteobacteria bacterium]|nr:hypothetical protein [Gammaproteobacteria bacterium]
MTILFAYYGGTAELLIPDNLRSAVNPAHRYEPQCQTTYSELARHYGCAIMPARSYKPKGELQPPEGGGFNLRLESRLSC